MGRKELEILIIEDDPSDAELIVRTLKKNMPAGRLAVLQDGEEALDFIFTRGKYKSPDPSRPPKVIFLDLKLPKIEGLEVLKEIKSNKKTKKIPVVVLSSSYEERDIGKAYETGANSYVVKPVDFETFEKKINQLGSYWLAVNEQPV